MKKRQVILAILDGWGIGAKNDSNPIYSQGTPNIDYIKANFLIGALQASGISVGLPWNEEGNSEVGHLTIGAGKVLYQNFPRITLSIQDKSFDKNKVFWDAFEHAKKNKSALNLAGLLTEGNVHASFDHLVHLINLSKTNQVPKINLHLFTDGRDSKPKSVQSLLKKLGEETGGGWELGSISGRFYSLDRDKHWDRTEETYKAMTGTAPVAANIEEIINNAYKKNLNDEYVAPRVVNPSACVKNNDSLLFFDFREDRARQIASAFILDNFSEFPTLELNNLYIATMTEYSKDIRAPIAYPRETIEIPIAKIISDNGKTQLHIAETEKYAHVTYFLNGHREQPLPGEYRVLVPSKKVISHAEEPEMQANEITSRVLQAVQEQAFDFIAANYANSDMIAHTGDYEAAKIAVKTIDENIGALIRAALEYNSVLIITSDHGNIEIMIDPKIGEPTTSHDSSPVPIYIIGNEFAKPKSKAEIASSEKETVGILSDIAPTILEIMDIPKPKEMTGQSLLKMLR